MSDAIRANINGRKGLLSANEVIGILGLEHRPNPPGALRWLMRTGKLAYIRLGKGIYGYREEDVQACIERCRVYHGQ